MGYKALLKQDTLFKMLLLTTNERMLTIYAVYAMFTHQINKNTGNSWNIVPSLFVVTLYVNTMMLISERH